MSLNFATSAAADEWRSPTRSSFTVDVELGVMGVGRGARQVARQVSGAGQSDGDGSGRVVLKTRRV